MSWRIGSRPVRSVLITRLRYLGDIVMSTVLIDVLRQGDPALRIGYLCEDEYADVLAARSGIDRLHRLATRRRGRDATARRTDGGDPGQAAGTLRTIADLRRERYDLAVDLFFNPRSAWLLRLAGIPARIGGTRRWRGRLYTRRVIRAEMEAAAPRFPALAPGGLGEHLCRLAPLTHVPSGRGFADWLAHTFGPGDLRPRLEGSPAGERGHDAALADLGLTDGRPYLLLAPCATWPTKEWPRERWEELVRLLSGEVDLPLVVMVAPGRAEDWRELVRPNPEGLGGVLPALPLADALAVAAGARGMVTVDGGLMHAAVGYGVPTVALFGPTAPEIWFPYEGAGPFRVLATAPSCHPCDLHTCGEFICLPDLQATAVSRTLQGLLNETAAAREDCP